MEEKYLSLFNFYYLFFSVWWNLYFLCIPIFMLHFTNEFNDVVAFYASDRDGNIFLLQLTAMDMPP